MGVYGAPIGTGVPIHPTVVRCCMATKLHRHQQMMMVFCMIVRGHMFILYFSSRLSMCICYHDTLGCNKISNKLPCLGNPHFWSLAPTEQLQWQSRGEGGDCIASVRVQGVRRGGGDQ